METALSVLISIPPPDFSMGILKRQGEGLGMRLKLTARGTCCQRGHMYTYTTLRKHQQIKTDFLLVAEWVLRAFLPFSLSAELHLQLQHADRRCEYRVRELQTNRLFAAHLPLVAKH